MKGYSKIPRHEVRCDYSLGTETKKGYRKTTLGMPLDSIIPLVMSLQKVQSPCRCDMFLQVDEQEKHFL